MTKIYWAADEQMNFVKKAMEYTDHWQNAAAASNQGISSMWLRNTISYYSTVVAANSWESSLGYEGEQGELVKMVIPRSRKLIRQIISLVTQQRLDFQSVSMIQEQDSIDASRIANALTEQLVEKQNLQNKGEISLEAALVLGSGFIKTTWRTDKGHPFSIDHESGNMQFTGDVEISVPDIYDVTYDASKPFWSDQDWVIIRSVKNRFDMVAQFPHLETEILALPGCKDSSSSGWFYLRGMTDEDSIHVYEIYHRPSPALPRGRMSMYSSDKCIYHDGENLYECLPIDIIQPEKFSNTGFGYPLLSDLLPAQEMLDHCYSAIATNQAATAVQSYMAPRGADISAHDIGGMNFLLFTPQNIQGGGKPEPLQLTQTAPETFKFADMIEAQLMKLAQLNNALIGEPNPGMTAGNAIATLTYNALRFMDSYIKAYAMALEGSMTKAIKWYSKFATAPMIVSIVGKHNKNQSKEFVGKDLGAVSHVKLELQSPLMQNIGGRFEIAEKLTPLGIIKRPQQMISILEGAPLRSLYEDELSENDLIQQERDMLFDGKMPQLVKTQDHPAHIRDHAAMLNDQTMLQQHGSVELILQHIEAHLQAEMALNNSPEDQMLRAIVRTGVAPTPPPPPPQAPPQALQQGGPMGPGGPQPPPEEPKNLGQEMMQRSQVNPTRVAQPASPAKPLQ